MFGVVQRMSGHGERGRRKFAGGGDSGGCINSTAKDNTAN